MAAGSRGERGAVARVVPADEVKQNSAVPDVPRDRPDLVERRRIGDQPVARDAPVAGLQPDHAAETGRQTDGTARVGTQRRQRLVGRDHRRRSAAGTSGHALQAPWVAGLLVAAVLGGRAHGELVHVGAAAEDQPGGAQPGDDRGIVGRDHAGQNARRAPQRLPGHREVVLHCQRDPVETAAGLAGGAPGVGGVSLAQDVGGIDVEIPVDAAVHCLAARQHRGAQLPGGDLAAAESGGGLVERERGQIGHLTPPPLRSLRGR